MEGKELILDSYSISDLTLKLFGKSNSNYKRKAIEFLESYGYNLDFFNGKNKNRKYEKLSKICTVCQKEFITLVGNKKEKETCSIGCSNSLKPKRIKIEIKVKSVREKNRKEKECEICNLIFMGTRKSRTCSKECLNKLQSNIMRVRVLNGEHKGWESRSIVSYPEQFFKKVLDNLKIPYEFNLPIKKSLLGVKSQSCYFLDFYIEKDGRKIDLEIDGSQHDLADRKKSDIERDRLLLSSGYEVYRIKWKNPVSDITKKYMETEIQKMKFFIDSANNVK
jgi:arsenate reductase-like glutaredoxin family protein